jgi:exopolyphosphatase / guanosine-5'-triphosphate,3'-diphosphate pyrophosphatase
MRRLASLDIGSQTIRLLVADVSPEGLLLPVLRNHAIIRLGEDMYGTGVLKDASITRAVSCIAQFIQQAEKLKPAEIYAVATACVRAAGNKAVFLNSVFNQTGVMPIVLTGQEEARIALSGVLSSSASIPESLIVLDIGGGSTELVCIANKKIIKTESISMGVIDLTERYLFNDPPTSSDISELRHRIQNTTKRHGLLECAWKNHKLLLGTAGTITTLAAMDLSMNEYNRDRINGHTLTLHRIEKLFKELLRKNKAERNRLAGLEPERSTVIIAGTAIVLEIMKALTIETLQVSDAGLLEGVLIQKIRS